jgi:uncharacterized protein (DUF488 family)
VSTLYTIGYEGTDIDRFIGTLKAAGVKVLADVRALALSRKKGFSKNSLRARLEDEGIVYTHFVELGDPKPGREAARAGRYDAFIKIYSRHLDMAASKSGLQSLGDLIADQPTCLLCFERDPATCHRSLIAQHLALKNLKVIHLSADDPDRYVRSATKLASNRTRQSATTA